MKHAHACLNSTGWQDPESVIQKPFILVLLPKETAAMNPNRFAAGSVPLDWCTNICAGAWERQGG